MMQTPTSPASGRARSNRQEPTPGGGLQNKSDCDLALYRDRNLVDRFFQFIKQLRGIAVPHYGGSSEGGISKPQSR